MGVVEIVLLLVVSGVCGAIGQAIAGYSSGGLLVTVAVGFIGALLGVWIARTLELPEIFVIEFEDASFPVVWSIAGSALFVAVISMLSKRKRS